MHPTLSIIIPVKNEALNIRPVFLRIRQAMLEKGLSFEMLYVDDGSTDTTLLEISKLATEFPNIFWLSFARNFGHQVAVTAGIDHAQGQYLVLMDGDGQDPPELIPAMLEEAIKGFDVVYAQRERRKGESVFKRLSAWAFYRLLNRWATVRIPLDTGDFRLISRKAADLLRAMPERHKFLRGQIAWTGLPSTAVPFERAARLHGETNYPLRRMVRLAWDGVTGFSTRPLQLATKMGFAVSGIAGLLIVWTLFVRLFGAQWGLSVALGWASIMLAVLFLGGIQLIMIGVLGEYLGRIYETVQGRPLYVIHQSRLPSAAVTSDAPRQSTSGSGAS